MLNDNSFAKAYKDGLIVINREKLDDWKLITNICIRVFKHKYHRLL